ncbi:MAG: thiamine phosphate synthase [Gammaproteobacteria bacterium]|nr:thiamine phosphate synthase [Gammaproteobacteria bacterium]
MRSRLRGLYGITDHQLLGDRANLTTAVSQALQGGMRLLQYRAKQLPPSQRLTQAEALRQLCSEHDALFLINDDVELALAVSADGVHLGRDDTSIAQARAQLGSQAIIGRSCYNRLELAQQAQAEGADYVAFGRFFPSQTKPNAVQAEPALLQQARAELTLPICAIGGITPANASILVEQGADMIAVIQGLFAHSDVLARAQKLSRLFPG